MFVLAWVLTYKYTPTNLFFVGCCLYGLVMYCVLPTGLRMLAASEGVHSVVLALVKTAAIAFTSLLAVFVSRGLDRTLQKAEGYDPVLSHKKKN